MSEPGPTSNQIASTRSTSATVDEVESTYDAGLTFDKVESKRDFAQFIELPHRIYAQWPDKYVPPIRQQLSEFWRGEGPYGKQGPFSLHVVRDASGTVTADARFSTIDCPAKPMPVAGGCTTPS